jgi:hypothetical protein
VGQLALHEDDLEHTEMILREALEALQKIGDVNCASRAMRDLGEVARRRGDFEQSRFLLAQSLRGYESLGVENNIARTILRFSALSESLGRGKRAALLLGAADFHLGGNDSLPPSLKNEIAKLVTSIQKRLGEREFKQLFAEGAAMSLQDAVTYALEENRED